MNELSISQPEYKEFKNEPKVKLFGDNIDYDMCEYAELVKNFDNISENKDNYDNLLSWQKTIENIDKQRKYQHDKITKIWLDSKFYNGTYNSLEKTDIKTFALDQEEKEKRFLKARKMVNKLAKNVYLKILDSDKKIISKDTSTNFKKVAENIEDLKKQGYLKYHNLDDFKVEKTISASENIIFSREVDKAINRYIDSNNSFSRIITRYEPGSEKSKQFIRNADENKTNFHRDIIKALIRSGFIPQINENEWLYEKWNDKENNKLRQMAEQLSEYYVLILNNKKD